MTLRGRLTKDWSEFDQQRAAESTGRPQRSSAVARTLRGGVQGGVGGVFAGAASGAVRAMLRARSRGLGGALAAGAVGAARGAGYGVTHYLAPGAFAGLGQGYLFGKSDDAPDDHDLAAVAELIQKYDDSEPRDERGRWTTGSSSTAAAAAADDDNAHKAAEIVATANRAVKVLHVPGEHIPQARGMVASAIASGYAQAKNLARKARHVITHSRIEDIRPVTGGGIQITMTHQHAGDNSSHTVSSLQLNPWMISQRTSAQKALQAMHITSHAIGRPVARASAIPISVGFKNGPVRGVTA